MFRRTVTAPNGTRWKLGRRWFPRWAVLWRKDPGDVPDVPSFDDDTGILAMIFLTIFAVIAAIFLALVLFNVIAIAIELLIFILALIVGLFSRVVLRKPWTVYAKSRHITHERHAVGWRGSRRLIDDMAARLGSGLELEPAPGDRR